ncbi:MAG: DUF6067 family protein [Kiritimatiellae bacterium]|nr:DUF6067 family protein [Kiritimatiellia bacterium]
MTDYTWNMPLMQIRGILTDRQSNLIANIPGKKGNNDWTECEKTIVLSEGVRGFRVDIILQQSTGKAWFDDLRVDYVPFSAKDKARAIELDCGGRKMKVYCELSCKKADDPLPQRIVKKWGHYGFAPYIREDPRDVCPESIPRPDEIGNIISLFAARGEYEPFWISVYSFKTLKKVRIKLAELVNANGDKISQDNVDARIVKCWPMGNAGLFEGYDRIYIVKPELLLKKSSLDVPENTSQSFYFTIKIPETAKPGTYRGKYVIESDSGRSRSVPVCIEVLPFSLDAPDNMNWFMHCTGNFEALRKPGMNMIEAATVAMRDIKEHGIEGIVLGCGYGPPAKLKVVDGKLVLVGFPKVEMVIPAMKRAGLKGPLIIHCGTMLENQVAEALGVEKPPVADQGHGGKSKTMETPEFKEAFKAALREIDKLVKKLGGKDFDWYYEGIDEPGGRAAGGRPERALWQWPLAKEAGFKGAAYISGDFWKKLAPFNTIQIFSGDVVYSSGKNAEILRDISQYKNVPFHYGYSGCYDGLPGGLMPSRWGAGFLSYISKVRGEVTWLYELGSTTDPNGVNQLKFYPKITYCVTSGEITPTLQWEGVREGIDDYRYVYTLRKLIEENSKCPGKREKSSEIDAKLETILATVPWGEDFGRVTDVFNNAMAAKYRRQIADWIYALMKN